MIFTISVIESTIQVCKVTAKVARATYRHGIFALACFWYLAMFCYCMGQEVRARYEAKGGNEWAMQELKPTIEAAKVFAGWMLNVIQWCVNDGTAIAVGCAVNFDALIEWSCAQLVFEAEPVVLFLERV